MSAPDLITASPVGPESNGMHMTPLEFDALQDWDENFRYELVNGVLIVVPPPGAGERIPNDVLGHLLRDYMESDSGRGVVDETAFEQTVACGENRRRADRVIWTGLGRAPDPSSDTPTIVVEFVSRSRRDRRRDYEVKREEYLAAGVQEYWVIDRYQRNMTVFRAEDQAIVIAEDSEYASPLLPSFVLPLGRLLACADRYPEE